MAKKSEEKNEGYSREDDQILSSEFKELENQENKFSFIKKLLDLFGQKKNKTPQEENVETKTNQNDIFSYEFDKLKKDFDNLLTKVERNTGKIELEDQNRGVLANRLSEVLSQVGELRSVIVTKERYFNQVETKVENLFQKVNMLSPEETDKKINNLKLKINSLEAAAAKSNSSLANMEDTVNKLSEKMGEVKSFKHVSDYLKNIQQIEREINKTRDFIDKKASRVELFAEDFREKFQNIDQHAEQIKTMNSTLNELDKKKDELANKIQTNSAENKRIIKNVEILKKEIYEAYLKEFSGNARPQQKQTGILSKIMQSRSKEILDISPKNESNSDEWIQKFILRSKNLNRSSKQVKSMLEQAGFQKDTIKSIIEKYGSN